MNPTTQSREVALSAARRLIRLIREERDKGTITNIEPSTIQELMSYLRTLASSDQNADTLENLCGGAILHHKDKNFTEYISHLKKIAEIGGNLL